MPSLCRSALAVILAAVVFCTSSLRVAAANDVARSVGTNGSTSICPSNSINYITQTLPQQCLATSWTRSASQAAASSASVLANDNVTTSQSNTLAQATDSETPHLAKGATSDIITSPTDFKTTSIITTTPTDVPAQTTVNVEQESDADPFADKGSFLSFEEWKKQMLEKSGQSPDHVGTQRAGIGAGQIRRRPGDINNALDTLGDDSEIELDFSGFVNSDGAPRPVDVTKKEQQDAETETRKEGRTEDKSERDNHSTSKSKDAGTTCKERFNYASFDCAATIMKTNSESKGSTFVLVENKDSYMLNPCKAKNKFFIVELCNDILIDTVVLANFEFFSSTFRTFRVSVSNRYPVKADKWRELGTFAARNAREIQPFPIPNAMIYARYLRLEFLTHYGVEYYCPVSLLRVHGKTMFDDWNDSRNDRGDEETNEDVSEDEKVGSGEEAETGEIAKDPEKVTGPQTANLEPRVVEEEEVSSTAEEETQGNNTQLNKAVTESSSQSPGKDVSIWVSYDSPLYESHDLETKSCNISATFCHLEHTALVKRDYPTKNQSEEASSILARSSTALGIPNFIETTALKPQHTKAIANSSALPSESIQKPSGHDHTQFSEPTKASTTQSAPSPKVNSTSNSNSTKSTPVAPPAATPSTQESFFKSISKRLQHLEQNSTLSLQYIEEQSRLLREAFTKVEKRQLSKTSNFLETLNTTVLSELRDFRALYDQMWQSTVLELSSQRQASQQEIVALSARLSILADETLFHKRMVVVQFFLILVCLILIMFSRMSSSPGAPAYADLQSAVRDVVSKPSVHLTRYLNLESPPGSPDTRPVSRYGFFSGRTLVPESEEHARSASSGSTAIEDGFKTNSATEARSSASAEEGIHSLIGEEEEAQVRPYEEKGRSQSPEVEQAALLRSWSSPAIGSQLQEMVAEEDFIDSMEFVDAVSGQSAAMDFDAIATRPHDVSKGSSPSPTPENPFQGHQSLSENVRTQRIAT